MIQVTEPSITAMIQKAPERTRSMIEPETIEAVVQENNRKAAQNTPFNRAHSAVSAAVMSLLAGAPPIWAPINSFHGSANGAATSPPVMPGPFTIEEYSHQPKK
jgi:hypothetical protein